MIMVLVKGCRLKAVASTAQTNATTGLSETGGRGQKACVGRTEWFSLVSLW